ncbi:MAG TPA: SPOR domain-containing protein [Paracoccaceae bacterium]|nr:SPOR domain-containing protein [Paracoccaceae bacterium]
MSGVLFGWVGYRRAALASAAAVLLLAGCQPGELFPQKPTEGTDATAAEPQMIEQDVEKPDVFSVTDSGLWDGRPSLGGVWVAHADVDEPERVIIRNTANDRFVIGALFRRERDNPGPALQVSSDAAEALGMLAGAPTTLSVVALRREMVPVAQPEPVVELTEATDIETMPLDPIAGAAAAIDAAEAAQAAPAPTTTPMPLPSPIASPLEKPFIQIGIFSIQGNALKTADLLRADGIIPTVLEQSSQGRTFWRIIVGPAMTSDERSALLAKVKELGFADAYYVTN